MKGSLKVPFRGGNGLWEAANAGMQQAKAVHRKQSMKKQGAGVPIQWSLSHT